MRSPRSLCWVNSGLHLGGGAFNGQSCYPQDYGATATASLSANPTSIISGQSSTLTWSSTNASSCTGTNFNTGGATSGTAQVTPTATTTYTVTCGSAQAQATVTVVFAYTLSNGGAVSVAPGNSAPQTVTATLTSGTTQSVSFGVSGLPTGATLSFPACSPTCTTNGTLATSSTTPVGTYTITVTGSPNNVQTSFTLHVTSSGGTITPPTLISHNAVSWSTKTGSAKTTSSFSVQANDELVAYVMTEAAAPPSVSISGGSLTWTQLQVVNVANYGWTGLWAAKVSSSGSISVTFTPTAGYSLYWGGAVDVFRGSGGIGASAATNATGAPALNLTTTQANSAIVVANDDYNDVNGSSRVWRTNAGALTEEDYAYVANDYTAYAGYHANAGTPGAYTVGLSAPSGQAYSIVAVEVLGSGGAPAPPTGLSATAVSSSQINLSWTGSSGATSYSVLRSATSGGPYTSIATGITPTSYSNTGLAPSTTYYYVVQACNGSGCSANSSQASATTQSAISTNVWYQLVNQTSGLCVNVSSASNGTVLTQVTCNSSDYFQGWQFQTAPTNGYYIIFSRSSLPVWLGMDDTNGSTSSGTLIQIWNYNSGDHNEQWEPVASGGYWSLVNLTSGLCLDDTNGSTSSGTQYQQYTCTSGNKNQEFNLVQQQ